jgi:hypothetical protein
MLSHSLVRSYQYWCTDWLTEDLEITQQSVRLELLKEETTEESLNWDATAQKMTLTRYVTTGLDIEDRQYVNSERQLQLKHANTIHRFQLSCEVANSKKIAGSKRQADLHERRMALQCQIQTWQQAQLVYTPHTASMVASCLLADENSQTPVETAEMMPLFLPSSFPSHIRSLPEIKQVCEVEKWLRFAQTEDTLVEIRRLRRVIQGLWQFKKLNVSGTSN